ncbi:MAG: osmoprotectant transport system substrate-binding protein [Acidimicrobiaceae bacterium]|nr:osmoprotectant transport system substrate-binding protein [Acidimicrobiaceae bacterium]
MSAASRCLTETEQVSVTATATYTWFISCSTKPDIESVARYTNTPAVTRLLATSPVSSCSRRIAASSGHSPGRGWVLQVARAYVQQKDIGAIATPDANLSITVGSAAFPENEMLADVYIEVLSRAGYKVNPALNLGNRETYEPMLEKGQVDLMPEYVGNYLAFVNSTVGRVELASAVSQLRESLAPKGLTVLDPSSATDSDTVVVTKSTADRFHLTNISDLGRMISG